MKRLLLTLLVFCFVACDKEDLSDGKETTVRFEAFELGSREILTTTFSSLRVIVLQNNVVERYYSFSAGDLHGGELSLNLPIGSYKILFIANAPEEKEVSCSIGDSLEEVLLNLLKEGNEYREASDFLTAIKQVNITLNQGNTPLHVSLRRRVGKLRVTLNDLSNDIDSLKIELGNAPKSSSVDGKVMGSAVNILKRMEYTKGEATATADIMTFPIAANKAEIGVLYSIGHLTYRGFMTLTPAIDSNRIVTVTGNYIPTLEQGFEFDVQTWDETNLVDGGAMLLGAHNEVVADNTPPAGTPVGDNLLQNGGFETWPDTPSPTSWSFDKDGTHKTVRKNTDLAYVLEGNSSCLLEEQTYLYQDIPVTERRCYQIRMKVNSNTSAYKWRVFCSWRKTASSALPAAANAAIQQSETGATDGWVDVFGGENKFRAPVGATILRVEVRTYSPGNNPINSGEGIYIDDFDVRLLEE
ncbi:MAG: FimB/Mfa2 family fimbrial subunit [Odoribacteraceae bacterium]|jgi:hypothetical protein|nr:FimB/Mfa2 family fimbrial subunit [Odoribacteraceae bacterium]